MTSSRPYLIRALYEWILDNECTPYILVDTDIDGVDVPGEYIKDAQLTLNVTPSAVQNLSLGNEYISFNARFSGKERDIFLPVTSVLAIYAQENGKGMVFSVEEHDNDDPPPSRHETEKKLTRPVLKIVK